MAITINKQPNIISAVGNTCVVQTTITGAYCELEINHEPIFREGTYEILSDPARAYPNASGNASGTSSDSYQAS